MIVSSNQSVPSPDSDAASPSFNKVVRSVIIFTLIGVILYAFAAFWGDHEVVFQALAGFPLRVLALVLGLVVLGWILRAARFHYYLKLSNISLPFDYVLKVFLASFALTGTPGKMGEGVKALFLKRDYDTPASTVVGILVVERLTDLLAILLLASFSVAIFSDWFGVFIICAGITLAFGLALTMEKIYRPTLEALSGFPVLGWISKKALEILLAGKDLMTPKTFIAGFSISVLAWGLESVCMFVIMSSMNLSATLLQANFVYCFGQIVGALSMLPGGIGGAEVSMGGLMSYMGIGYSRAVPAIMLLRVATLWFAILTGILFMAIMAGYSVRHIPARESKTSVSEEI
jgi:uncharacterized protein (TIRG00374 family)